MPHSFGNFDIKWHIKEVLKLEKIKKLRKLKDKLYKKFSALPPKGRNSSRIEPADKV